WNAGADAGLAHGALEAFTVDVLAPIAEFAETVGDDLERIGIDRPIDFLAAEDPFAVAGGRIAVGVFFPREALERVRIEPRGRRRYPGPNADVGIGDRGMLEPGEIVAQERFAEPVVIKARQPLGLREEVVDLGVGLDVNRLVVVDALEADAGQLIFVVVPLVL